MKKRLRMSLAIAAAGFGAAAIFPSAMAQGDPAPQVDVISERSVMEAPSVTLPRGVVEAASAYKTYLVHAAAIRAAFRDGESISRAMNVGEAYQPQQLEEGLIAYAALIAMEDERFVRGIQSAAPSRAAADRIAEALLADPAQVAAIPGAGDASALIGATVRRDGAQLFATGRAVKQSAYDIQHQAWSRYPVSDQVNRLAQAKSMGQFAYIPAPDEVSHLLQFAASFRGLPGGDAAEARLTPAIQRGLTLAALALLGEAGDEARLAPILSEGGGAACMKMAKLNLYQCLAVAGPHYEDIFCLGQHALMDTGQCVSGMAGGDAGQSVMSVPVAENTYSR